MIIIGPLKQLDIQLLIITVRVEIKLGLLLTWKEDLLFQNTKYTELNSFRRVYSSEDNEYLLQNKHLSLSKHTHTHTRTMGKNQVHMGSNSGSTILASVCSLVKQK